MPRTCTICRHPERESIDSAIAGGRAFRDIAAQWDLASSSVGRHAKSHLADSLALARQARSMASGLTAVELLDAAAVKAAERLLTAEPGRDTDAAIASACRVVEIQGRLEARLGGPTVGLSVDTTTIEDILAEPELAQMMSDRAIAIELGRGDSGPHQRRPIARKRALGAVKPS